MRRPTRSSDWRRSRGQLADSENLARRDGDQCEWGHNIEWAHFRNRCALFGVGAHFLE